MLSSPDVNPGDEVVNRYGQIGTVIAWVPAHNALAVLTDAENPSQLWDEWAVNKDEVTQVYDDAIKKLAKSRDSMTEEVNSLRVTHKALQLEIANMQMHLEKLKANPITAEALKLIEEGVKVLVDENGNIENYEHVPRHDKAHRLLWMQLVPSKRYGKYSWMVNSYSDGSGTDRVVWPFSDEQEARSFAVKILEHRLLDEIPKIKAETASMAESKGQFPTNRGGVPSMPIQALRTRVERWSSEAGRAALMQATVPEEYITAVGEYRLILAKLEAEQAASKARELEDQYQMLKGGAQ